MFGHPNVSFILDRTTWSIQSKSALSQRDHDLARRFWVLHLPPLFSVRNILCRSRYIHPVFQTECATRNSPYPREVLGRWSQSWASSTGQSRRTVDGKDRPDVSARDTVLWSGFEGRWDAPRHRTD